MSATRTKLLAAAALTGALAPTTPCWAQAYGAAAVVEHNDLRWFEPVEVDIDGQMPRDDAGFFFSVDKLYWATINPRVEIGHEGLVVDSERIYQAPSVDLALTSLEQTQSLDFVDNLSEVFAVGSVRFATVQRNDPTIRRDDVETVLGFGELNDAFTLGNAANPGLTNVAELRVALARIESGYVRNPDGVANNGDEQAIAARAVRVAGEPQAYAVQNGIQDALPDAGWAWGERYEFGYSDGEQGWSMTVLDGPEAQAGGTFGAGEAAPYTSQSGTDVFGPDPYFLGDLVDDDGDGIGDGDGEQGAADLFALGFGSVAVNFNLPNETFLTGFRDYTNGESPFTVFGPILYVGNLGSEFTDIDVIDIDLGGAGGTLSADAALNLSGELLTDVNGGTMTVAVANNILASITASVNTIQNGTASFNDDGVDTAIAATQASIALIQTAITTAGSDPFAAADKTAITTQITALNTSLTQLDAALSGLDLGGDLGDGQDVTVNEEDRLADDLNGDGAPGFRNVVAIVDGEEVIVGRIIDFDDLYTFNVFFDEVTVRNRTEIDGVELMRTHQVSTRHKLQQGRWDDVQFAYGVRFVDLRDDFYFQGRGSILGRTTVETDAENQVVGPQLGLKWIRRDGPWDFVLEGRGVVGYNIVDIDQRGIFGEELVPGALNRPATGRTTASYNGVQYNEFSPLGELRAQLRYRVASAITLQAGYTATYIANIHRGSLATAWNAPDFGIDDSTSNIFSNGLNFGVEFRH